jgi:hypothetical protein
MLDEKVMIHGQVWLYSDIEKEVSWCKSLVWGTASQSSNRRLVSV